MIHSHQTTFGRFGRVVLVFIICTLLVFATSSFATATAKSHGGSRGKASNPKGAGRANKVKSAVTIPDTFQKIQLTHDDADSQGQPSVAVDNSGNVHVVYTDDTNPDGDAYLIYKMFRPDGTVLIDDTPIVATSGDYYWATRSFIACDSANNVHVVFQWYWWNDPNDNTRSWYTKLTPYADDLNGSASTTATIQSVAPKMVSQDTSGSQEHYPRIAIDKDDNVHLVYTDNGDSEVYYRKLDNNGDGVTGFVDIGIGGGYHEGTGIDVDSSGNVHILTADFNDYAWYSMLDDSGNILIDQTAINDYDAG